MTGHDIIGGFMRTVSSGEGVYISQLPPRTTLLVRTLNSLYRLVITQAPEVCIHGGFLFPEPTAAWLVGSRDVTSGRLKLGWIGIGLRIELRSRDRQIVTSRVRAITTDARSGETRVR